MIVIIKHEASRRRRDLARERSAKGSSSRGRDGVAAARAARPRRWVHALVVDLTVACLLLWCPSGLVASVALLARVIPGLLE